MNKARPNPESFTVRLGHPVFIFFWSVWMVVLGVVLGVHLHPSRAVGLGISILCATLIVVHPWRSPKSGHTLSLQNRP